MKNIRKYPSALFIGGVLCAAFALNACSGEETPLPPRESPESVALYHQCLKTLPDGKAHELEGVHDSFFPSDLSKYDSLLRECRQILSRSPAPGH